MRGVYIVRSVVSSVEKRAKIGFQKLSAYFFNISCFFFFIIIIFV